MSECRPLRIFKRYINKSKIKIMAYERCFRNTLPDYQNNLIDIPTADLKDRIVEITNNILTKVSPTEANCDGGIYVGLAGVAFTFYYLSKSPLFTAKEKDNLLHHSLDYIVPATDYTRQRENLKSERSAFLLGNAGAYAVAAVTYKRIGDDSKSEYYRKLYVDAAANCKPTNFLRCGGDELFVGRAGYLCGALWMSRELGVEAVPNKELIAICNSIVCSGAQYSREQEYEIPLMYTYYDTEYLGAAHGLCFILQMLMSVPNYLESHPSEAEMIKRSVDFLLNMQLKSGNFPTALEDTERPQFQEKVLGEELVHWCHGAPGVVYTMAKAYLLWKDEKYLTSCLKCGDLVWEKGLLKKGPGICHGIAGNAYVFLCLYRLTMDNKHLHRALKFGDFLKTSEFKCGARTPDSPYSLYEGLAGTACFYADLAMPIDSNFFFQDIFPSSAKPFCVQ